MKSPKISAICFLLIIALIASYSLYGLLETYRVSGDNPSKGIQVPISTQSPVKLNSTQNKATSSLTLNQWLSKLAKMEGCPPSGGMDSDHTLSYGIYCYKKGTFEKYSKKYGIKGKLGDPLTEYRLTYAIVENEPRAVVRGLWFTSVVTRGLGLPPRQLAVE